MHIALLSPYHSGSHAAWASQLQRWSSHAITLHTLPGRFWKWRMHGGAVSLAQQITAADVRYDAFLATSMLDLTTFLALTREQSTGIPVALYMHENQLIYPLPEDPTTGAMRRQLGERDHHYVWVNWSSMLAADHIFFNSAYHLNSWFEQLPKFLKHFPDFNQLDLIAKVQAKSDVLPVGVPLYPKPIDDQPESGERPPLILWNQRWEYDKNPGEFFEALYRLQVSQRPFRLAVCGENFRRQPAEFDQARERLAEQIVHWGYADRETYGRLLWQADITLSTAYHEFFGISIMEAIQCHTFPILPKRLSYPELIPEEHHPQVFYDGPEQLDERLRWACDQPQSRRRSAAELAAATRYLGWDELIHRYDHRLANLISAA